MAEEPRERGRSLGARKGGLNGTVCRSRPNWRLFCNFLFVPLGICEAGRAEKGGERRPFSQRHQQTGLTRRAKLNSGPRTLEPDPRVSLPYKATSRPFSLDFFFPPSLSHVTNNQSPLWQLAGPFRLISQAFQPRRGNVCSAKKVILMERRNAQEGPFARGVL